MKKFILSTILFGCCISVCFGQQPRTSVNPTQPKPAKSQIVTEISEIEWKNLTDALRAEDWKNSALLASQYLERLANDNEKKQLARLRYFYLYALAGKILAVTSGKVPVETDSLWKELDAVVSNFIAKEFILPPRRFLPECREVVNYVCPVKDNERALRVTATNNEGTVIHSFDYVLFDEKIALDEFAGRETFLGGKLKRVEFNQDMSKPWVMRLIFEKGFVRVIVADEK
jgi:hypothetical protein